MTETQEPEATESAEPAAETLPTPATAAEVPAPESTATRKRRWPIFVGIAVVVAVAVGVGAYFATEAAREQARKDAVVKAAAIADKRIDHVFDAFKSRDTAWNSLTPDQDPKALQPVIAGTLASYEKLDADIEAARKEMKGIDAPAVSKAYLQVCDELAAAVEENRKHQLESSQTLLPYANVTYGDNAVLDGNEALNNAVDRCNARKFAEGKTLSKEAEESFRTAANEYASAAKKGSDKSFPALVTYAQALVKLAQMQGELARIGNGSAGAYNRQIDRCEKQAALCEDLESRADVGGIDIWKRIRNGNGRLVLETEDTYERWEKAQDLVESAEF